MLSRVAIKFAAWLLFATIAAVTLSPIGFRPTTPGGAGLERFAALALLGAFFVLAYPTARLRATLLLIGAAGALELLQNAVPGRHGMVDDLLVKGLGVACGAVLASAMLRLAVVRRMFRLSDR